MNAKQVIAALAVKREALAQKVLADMKSLTTKLTALEAGIRALWVEFDNLKEGETILACATKKEFCEKHLHRTPRAVQYMLAGGNPSNKINARRDFLRDDHNQTSEIISPVQDVSALKELRDYADELGVKTTISQNPRGGFIVDDGRDPRSCSAVKIRPYLIEKLFNATAIRCSCERNGSFTLRRLTENQVRQIAKVLAKD